MNVKKSNNLCTFYIIRHGETQWNVKGILQGHSDSPLTEKGQEQAKEAAKNFKGMKFDAIYSSDLLRAQKTAEIIALEHKLAVNTTRALRERFYGEFEGKPRALLNENRKIAKTLTDLQYYRHKVSSTAESDEEIVSRLLTFLRELALIHTGKNVLIASHGGMMSALLVHLGRLSYKKRTHREITNGALIKLESDGVEFYVKETKGITFPE